MSIHLMLLAQVAICTKETKGALLTKVKIHLKEGKLQCLW